MAASIIGARCPGETLAIVGGGMAAQRLCEGLVERSFPVHTRVVVFAEESTPAYDRVHLSDVLTGRDASELRMRPDDWYGAHGIEWETKAAVEEIDLVRRTVASSRGHVVRFDKLVLATGSRPILPGVPGNDLPGVFTYRSMADVQAIDAAAATAGARGQRAVVVGGGLLGLEVADRLIGRGCAVTVVERAPVLLPRQLDHEASELLREQVESRGFDLLCSTELSGIEARSGATAGLQLTFSRMGSKSGDGTLDADLVVFAVGVRPEDELARQSGIRCHRGGGILVDDQLLTSEADVFAIGECARHRDTLYGLVSPAYAMADALANRLAGEIAAFEGVTPGTRLKLPGIEIAVVGDSLSDGREDRVWSYGDAETRRSVVVRNGRLAGAISVGSWEGFAGIQEAVSRSARLRISHERRFRDSGELFRSPTRPIAQWNDDAIVCTCTGVTCGVLRAAQAEGCRTAAELAAATSASTVCGTCKPQLEELCGEAPSGEGTASDRGLLIAASVGLVIVLAVLSLPAVPPVESVREFGYDVLWRDPFIRKVTGFTALGLALTSLVLSLRKRWPRLSLGPFAKWRRIHAVIGSAALVAVGVHTGMRMGSSLDFALMASFLVLSTLGGAAAGISALQNRLPAHSAGVLRRVGQSAHIFVFWPFLALVGFHVFKVFWF